MAEAVTQVVNQYKAELEGSLETVKSKGQNLGPLVQENVAKVQQQLQEAQPQIQAQIQVAQESLVPKLQDMGPVPEGAHAQLMQSHIYAGICLLAVAVSQQLGATVLAPLIGLIFDAKFTFLLAYMLLPVHYYLQVTRGQAGDEPSQRFVLLAGSVLTGLLSGFTLSDRAFSFIAPPAFIVAGAMGGVAGLMGPGLAGNRQTYLGAVVGAAVGVCFVLGLLTGSMGIGFLLYLMVTGAAVAAIVQLVIGGVIPGNQLAAEGTIVALLSVQFLMSFLLGGSKQAAADAQAQQKGQAPPAEDD